MEITEKNLIIEHLREIIRLERKRESESRALHELSQKKHGLERARDAKLILKKHDFEWLGVKIVLKIVGRFFKITLLFLTVGYFALWLIGLFIGHESVIMYLILFATLVFCSAYPFKPIYKKIMEVRNINKFNRNAQIEKKKLEMRANKEIPEIEEKEKEMRTQYKETQNQLQELCSKNIIFDKYQHSTACYAFLEYLESGRCSELKGPNGVYNLYEQEQSQKKQAKLLDKLVDETKGGNRKIAEELSGIKSTVKDISNDIKVPYSERGYYNRY